MNFRKNIYMNMNYNYLTTIYESVYAKMYKFLVEKYIFPIFAYKFFMVKTKTCKKNPDIIYIRVKILSYIVVG